MFSVALPVHALVYDISFMEQLVQNVCGDMAILSKNIIYSFLL